jgi:hypothetical protein
MHQACKVGEACLANGGSGTKGIQTGQIDRNASTQVLHLHFRQSIGTRPP